MARGRRRKPAAGPSLFDAARPDLDMIPAPPLAEEPLPAPQPSPDPDPVVPDIRIPLDRRQAIARGDALRAVGKSLPLCHLPPPQERVRLPAMPGRREDGVLWFESH